MNMSILKYPLKFYLIYLKQHSVKSIDSRNREAGFES